MGTRVKDALWALTEKEKQTLRLIVRGHDAKSIARSFGLSVHTINERLRDARRKMAVSSSREAARLLLEAEGGDPRPPTPYSLGDGQIGDDAAAPRMDQEGAPVSGVGRRNRRSWIIVGVLLMIFVLGLLALTALPQAVSGPAPTATTATAPAHSEVVGVARQWLGLLDQGRWDESYRATGASFQKNNTLKVWTDVSLQARAPLGAMISRTLVSHENLPAPPHGYEVVKFRTSYANRAEAIETVTLDRENGAWRIVGVMIE